MPPIAFEDDSGNSFLKYRAPSASFNNNNFSASDNLNNNFADFEQPSSWLHGSDFNSMAGDLFSSKTGNNAQSDLSALNLNLDQIKIGDQTMENVLKALDPSSTTNTNTNNNFYGSENAYTPINYNTNANINSANPSSFYKDSSFLNGLNLDSSFSRKISGGSTNNTRANIIKSHASNLGSNGGRVSFQQPLTSQFFSSPDESFVNMTLPAVDTSIIFSDSARGAATTANSFKPAVPTFRSDRDKEQFINFAVQQYRMLAGMNPEMMRAPESVEDLAERETFKYWAKLFVEERERQARIVLNLQKALTEALSGQAAKGPNVLGHLGTATGDYELETIGKFADQCRRRSQMISSYFNNKRKY